MLIISSEDSLTSIVLRGHRLRALTSRLILPPRIVAPYFNSRAQNVGETNVSQHRRSMTIRKFSLCRELSDEKQSASVVERGCRRSTAKSGNHFASGKYRYVLIAEGGRCRWGPRLWVSFAEERPIRTKDMSVAICCHFYSGQLLRILHQS